MKQAGYIQDTWVEHSKYFAAAAEVKSRMNSMYMTFRQAKTSDIESIYSIVNEVSKWLIEKEIYQWEYPYPKAQIMKDISEDRVFLALDGNEVIGTFSLKEREKMWPKHRPDCIYLYRLAVALKFLGRKIGYKLLYKAALIANSKNKKCLRLDCWAGNRKLRKYYFEAGFNYLGDVPVKDYEISLFEKIL